MELMGVGLLGCGTVGSGVAELLLQYADRLSKRAKRRLELKYILVRDRSRKRPIPIPEKLFASDIATIINDKQIEVVIELMGGVTEARHYVLAAIQQGKHIVTANKALIAECGIELFEAARQHGVTICFEASVAGGVPIIGTLAQSMSANQLTGIQGILNGTSNFILSSMSDEGKTYGEALQEAQRMGYAEADPRLDVDGSDAAHKLAILAQIAFGINVNGNSIERMGIDKVHAMDIRFASELGYTIKMLAEGWLTEGEVALHVAPVLLRKTEMLAQVRGVNNAIQVIGDVVGDTLYQGPGAGRMPTASAVVADLIDLAIGRAQKTFDAANLWTPAGRGYSQRPASKVHSRFYLRVLVEDRPGMLADVARVLADRSISIASVIQHEAVDFEAYLKGMNKTSAQLTTEIGNKTTINRSNIRGGSFAGTGTILPSLIQPSNSDANLSHPTDSNHEHFNDIVPLVIMTHYAPTGNFRDSVSLIDHLPGVKGAAVYYSVDD